jgi:hypothetical protein
MSLAELNSNCSSRLRLLVFAHTDMAKRMAFFVCGVVTRMVKKIERVGKTRLAASTSLFGLPSPPSRLGRNLSDCQRQISQKRTSGPRRRDSALAHTFRVVELVRAGRLQSF